MLWAVNKHRHLQRPTQDSTAGHQVISATGQHGRSLVPQDSTAGHQCHIQDRRARPDINAMHACCRPASRVAESVRHQLSMSHQLVTS